MLRALILIALASLCWLGCSTPGGDRRLQASASPRAAEASATPSPSASPGEEKPVRLEKTMIKTKQGQRWELEADEVDWMDNNSQAKARDVTWFLLGPKGERTIKVDSKGADVNMKSEVVTFTGKVVAKRIDSVESLVVERLVYKGKEKLFYGSEGVLWKRKDIELSGQTLTATAELDKVQLKGRVKGKTQGGLLKTDSLEKASD